ncbi:hypothetical protein C1H46_032622 [Malus baccata]|uniref:UDP-glycosyltransferases domain-containing protein n=1 Tax=Malus baccata TaxID=106549 RepID=A0A540L5P7_MALBA|nr:hypothetical protein C1H46_032622 [Malus baccata]
MASENRDSENREFHVCFFPFMAHGHMIPVSDMAKLFASQGVKTTIVTTPLNAPTFSKATQSSKTYSGGVIKTIKFPSVEAGLPEGLIFHGTCFFALAASDIMTKYEPFKNTSSDSDPFVIPDFPGEIITETCLGEKLGILALFLYAIETMKKKHLRGKSASITEHDFLKWLDSKEPNSVVYVCFGSVAKLNASQLKEIAMGLEASGKDFIWVVRTGQDYDVLILDHGAVGGFVTHCGWNSTLEGIAAGLPMVTWPVSAEQFYNEKLVTQVLKIGAGVGAQKWIRVVGDSVKKEAVEKL